MLSIAIVDDEEVALKELKSALVRYFSENKIEDYFIAEYRDGRELLERYDGKFDVIYLDIDMTDVNGLKTAKAIRSAGDDTAIVFVTRLARYAVKCYDYNAWDFIVKPINYFSFAVKLGKLLRHIAKIERKRIKIECGQDVHFVDVNDIYYVEIQKHALLYHTVQGEIRSWGSLRDAVDQIGDKGFCSCNRCYYVNLRYVSAVNDNVVTVGGDKLEISRNKKKSFMTSLASYFGQGDNR